MFEYHSYFEKWGNKMPSDLNENEFTILKDHFKSIRSIKEASPRDCMLYFGLWWKFEYDEGFLSKERVFESLQINENEVLSNTALEFYKRAKIGGYNAKLKWIRIENTLYLRTLLLNGGIPLLNLKNNIGRWKTFLVKVIENKVTSPQEISNNYELIKYLPISSRNDNIYEVATQISNAIWNNDVEGEKFLNILEHNEQGELVKDLRGRHKSIINTKKSELKYKAFWELILLQNRISIYLNFDFPYRISKESITNLLNTNLENLENTYNLYCNDHLVATYKKNINDDFLKVYVNSNKIQWDPENVIFPLEVYFVDDLGNKYFIRDLIRNLPSLMIPTLWVQLENNRWLLNSGNSHDGDTGFVLSNFSLNLLSSGETYTLGNCQFHFFQIHENFIFNLDENDPIVFNLNTRSKFSCYFNSKLPDWIYSSNKKIVSGFPNMFFNNNEGDKISETKILIEWRKKNTLDWKVDRFNFPTGMVSLRFTYEDQVEYDEVFNIGNAVLTIKELNSLVKIICFEHIDLKLNIDQNLEFYQKSNENNCIKLTFNNTSSVLTRVSGNISTESSSIRIKFSLPITSNDLIDKYENIVPNDNVFLINDIDGIKLLIKSKVKLKLYNKKLPNLKIEKIINKGEIYLNNYNPIIQNLFLLNDVMDQDNLVVFEFGEKVFNFKLYNLKLKWKDERDKIEITDQGYIKIQVFDTNNIEIINFDENFKLYAVPLNCKLESIVDNELFYKDGCFQLKILENINEYIIFSNYNYKKYKVLPTYLTTDDISFDTNNLSIKNEIKYNRIKEFSSNLELQNFDEDEWSKLLTYIQLCKQYNIPFSTFDDIRAASTSDSLVAKLFIFLILFSSNNDDFFNTCTKIEDDLGFRFQWSSFDEFTRWIDFAINLYSNNDPTSLYKIIVEKVRFYPGLKFIFFEDKNWKLSDDFHLNTKILKLRSDLGDEVISELPFYPELFLNDKRKNIISQKMDNPNIEDKFKIILRTPVVVALSKLKMYQDEISNDPYFKLFWHLDNNLMRRNMIYCEEKNPEWFNIALSYSINRIKNIK